MTWVLVLIIGGGYGATNVTGYTSQENCERAYQAIHETNMGYARQVNAARPNDVGLTRISGHYCVEVR